MPRGSFHKVIMCWVSWFLVIMVLMISLMCVQAFCMMIGLRVSGPAAFDGSKDFRASSILSGL